MSDFQTVLIACRAVERAVGLLDYKYPCGCFRIRKPKFRKGLQSHCRKLGKRRRKARLEVLVWLCCRLIASLLRRKTWLVDGSGRGMQLPLPAPWSAFVPRIH